MTGLEALVERAAQGDGSAFGQLVSRCWGLVYAICLGEVGRPTDAEDLTQEVFVQVHRDLGDLRAPGRFLAWLRQVTRNVCRMWLRRGRIASVPLGAGTEQEDPTAVATLREAELAEIVGRMLAQVSPKSREVLALHYLAGCSEADIAETLGLLSATVKSRLREAREQAKRKLLPVVRELLSLQTPSEEIVEQIMARCGNPGCICPDMLLEGR